MQTYISPIGFNTTSVTRALITHGIEGGDAVVLVRPAEGADDARATEAVADVERILQKIEPTISIRVEKIPHNDFEPAVLICSETIRTAEGSVVVSLSGGARDVLVPLTVATMAHEQIVDSTLGYSDLDGRVREWLLPNITTTPSDGQRETLDVLNGTDSEVSIPELTTKRAAAKSTITRHVNALEANGFVTSRMIDRTKHVSITLAGRLCLARSASI